MRLHRFAIALGAALLAAGAPGARADPLYTVDFLPAGFGAAALNNGGQVVGTSGDAAAIVSGGILTSLSAIAPLSYGRAINSAGAIAGTLDTPYGGRAFSYIGGTLTDLNPLLSENFFYSNAAAINDSGAVGGLAYPFVGEAARGFIYQGGAFQYLGTLGGDFSGVAALNTSGAATGVAAFEGPALLQPYHAIYYADGVLQDLGSLGGARSEGADLNDAGDVVGWAEMAGDDAFRHPFLYRDGSLQDLGTLGGSTGEAHAINNLGAIVGNAYLAGDAILHAFLYRDGKLVDLNSLVDPLGDWALTAAYDINDAGQILGTACQGDNCASVLLSPVPEPAAGALMACGLALLAAMGARRRGGGAPAMRPCRGRAADGVRRPGTADAPGDGVRGGPGCPGAPAPAPRRSRGWLRSRWTHGA
jgi:probable HAF family extracellular repeat protein